MLLWLLACRGGSTWVVSGDPRDTDPPADTDPGETDLPDTDLPTPTGDTAEPTPPFVEATTTEAWQTTIALRTNVPMDVAACTAVVGACDDADADGLADLWEQRALEAFVPLVRFDEAEPLIDDPDAVFRAIGRVTPVDGHVRAFVVLAYHHDYGRCGLSSHPGDSERVVVDLLPLSATDVGVVGAYTAAHENAPTDQSTLFAGADLVELVFEGTPPRWVVFASEGKHATYGTGQRCEDASFIPCVEEDCLPDGVADPALYDLLPPATNAGEPGGPLLTALDALGFPGEQAWIEQSFCGGQGGGLICAGSIRSKLSEDPF